MNTQCKIKWSEGTLKRSHYQSYSYLVIWKPKRVRCLNKKAIKWETTETGKGMDLCSPEDLIWSAYLEGILNYAALTSSICFTTCVFLVHQRLLYMQHSHDFLKGVIACTLNQSYVKLKMKYFVEKEWELPGTRKWRRKLNCQQEGNTGSKSNQILLLWKQM